ncbi:19500_t:CDS:2, partial [Cetraspora pellucida]
LTVPKNNTDETIVATSFHVSQFCRELAEAKIDLVDVIMMLSMRPAEVATLCIIHYEPKAKNNPEPQQFLSIEKNLEYAKELLTWIQDAIATRKLHNPIYSINRKHSTRVFNKFLKSYFITAKRLRKIEAKHVSKIHK